MRLEIEAKVLEANYTITEQNVLDMPEKYQVAYKNYKEIEELVRQKKEFDRIIDEKINSLAIPFPQKEKIPEYYWSATEIGLLVEKNCSVIGKLASSNGYKDKAYKSICGIDNKGFQIKYYYDYDTVIEIAKFYGLFTIDPIPNKEELKEIIEILFDRQYHDKPILAKDNELLSRFYLKQGNYEDENTSEDEDNYIFYLRNKR